MRAAALPLPLARLASLRHYAMVACGAAQMGAKSDVSTPHRQTGRRAAAPIHIRDVTRACVSIWNTQLFVLVHVYS